MDNGRAVKIGHDGLTPTRRREVRDARKTHVRLRRRRLRRRAYIRSAHFLPSMATLGNAVCGFAAVYVAQLDLLTVGPDPVARFFAQQGLTAACYLIALAMVFDGLDGRLARITRHTSDFGAQLDSLSDVISFGFAPAFIGVQAFARAEAMNGLPPAVSRLVWACGALFLSCAALRLARFNVSNEHGEQHHFSFLGLPSPGAGGAVVSLVLLQQWLLRSSVDWPAAGTLATVCTIGLPPLLAGGGLLMVSSWRYPHLVNRYARGRRSFARLVGAVAVLLLLIVAHEATLAVVGVGYALWGLIAGLWVRVRRRPATVNPG